MGSHQHAGLNTVTDTLGKHSSKGKPGQEPCFAPTPSFLACQGSPWHIRGPASRPALPMYCLHSVTMGWSEQTLPLGVLLGSEGTRSLSDTLGAHPSCPESLLTPGSLVAFPLSTCVPLEDKLSGLDITASSICKVHYTCNSIAINYKKVFCRYQRGGAGVLGND